MPGCIDERQPILSYFVQLLEIRVTMENEPAHTPFGRKLQSLSAGEQSFVEELLH